MTHFIFDVDSTLVQAFTENILPDAAAWFKKIPDDSVIDICTNNGGVGFRWWLQNTEPGQEFAAEKNINPLKYHNEQQAIARLHAIANKLTGGHYPIGLYYCFAYTFKANGKPAPNQYASYRLAFPPVEFGNGLEYAEPGFVFDEQKNCPPEWRQYHRKPNPGMIMEAYHRAAAGEAIFVGDSEDDKMAVDAAQRAGVKIKFVHRDEFFGGEA